MSSIVKARTLYDVSFNSDYTIVRNENIRQEREKDRLNMNELNEKREAILKQAITKAKQIEAEANARAEALIDNAKKSSKEIMLEAELKGYEEGFQCGIEDGRRDAEKAAELGLLELTALIEAMKKVKQETLQAQEEDLLHLAFEIAHKIMRQQVQSDEAAVLKMVEDIIQENEGNAKIFLSEYQKSLGVHLDKATIKKIKGITKDAKVVIVKEDDIIMAETETGTVDMSVPVQIDQLKQAVGQGS